MEFRDKGPEVETLGGGNLLKNQFVQIIAGLIGLAVLGIIILLLFVFRVLPPGRGASSAVAPVSPTSVTVAQRTAASTPAAAVSETPNPSATAVAASSANTPVTIPTTTTAAATPQAPKAGSAGNVAPGLYVTRLRADPSNPQKGEPISFFVSFLNTSGRPQVHRLCVQTYRLGEDRSFGSSSCTPQTIPLGSSELKVGISTITGIHGCLPIRARPITADNGQPSIPMRQPGGGDLWLDLQVCP